MKTSVPTVEVIRYPDMSSLKWVGTNAKNNFPNYKEWTEEAEKSLIGCDGICQQSCKVDTSFCASQDKPTQNQTKSVSCRCKMTPVRNFRGQICSLGLTPCLDQDNPENLGFDDSPI
eukprot:TCALIF_06298-PA protein Name:"Protein of unknown function" AED:0.01 eAED:0.01 QI:11/1/0.5/1/0/0/2/0/116